MSDLSEVIQAVESGDPVAAERLLPLVYDELRRLAAARLANELPGQTLQPTALVHETYLRLTAGAAPVPWTDRRHFFAAAAIAMQRILIDEARRKNSLKRGGRRSFVSLDGVDPAAPESSLDLLALDAALAKLAAENPQAANLVRLLYFGGLNLTEAASALQTSPRTVGRIWTYARAWLRRELEGAEPLDENR